MNLHFSYLKASSSELQCFCIVIWTMGQ